MAKQKNGLEPKSCSTSAAEEMPALASESLFGERREIEISHRGSRYLLRITQQGKLVLHKTRRGGDE
jgi:hemin uptake protein HemP